MEKDRVDDGEDGGVAPMPRPSERTAITVKPGVSAGCADHREGFAENSRA